MFFDSSTVACVAVGTLFSARQTVCMMVGSTSVRGRANNGIRIPSARSGVAMPRTRVECTRYSTPLLLLPWRTLFFLYDDAFLLIELFIARITVSI